MGMTRDDITQAYQWILGRPPEGILNYDELLVLEKDTLRNRMLNSIEFKQLYAMKYLSLFKFAFIRIPKTASTSIVQAFQRHGLTVREFADENINAFDAFRSTQMISGHFSYNDILPTLGGITPVFLSTVRDPIKRIVSLYRQAFDEEGHPCHEEVRSLTLDKAIKRDGMFFSWVFNAQCRHISGRHSYEDTMSIIKSDHFILCNTNGIKTMIGVVGDMVRMPRFDISNENVSSVEAIESIKNQADFGDAMVSMHWVTTEDRKLFSTLGTCYFSPKMKDVLSEQIGIRIPSH